MSEIFEVNNIDIEKVIKDLRVQGGTSLPFLKDEFRQKLVEEAKTYPFKIAPEYVGTAGVRQQLSTYFEFPKESLFFQLRDEFTDFLEDSFNQLEFPPFSEKLNFNEMQLQKYEPGSIGITAHRDHIKYRNLIAIFYLEGSAKFSVCEDINGKNAIELDASPDNLILLRAPGFYGLLKRPYHFAINIPDERYLFSLRCDSKSGDAWVSQYRPVN